MGYANSIRNKITNHSRKPEKLFQILLESISSYLTSSDRALIKKAYEFSAHAHEGQTRLSGEPYI